jgi:hypothetical protein
VISRTEAVDNVGRAVVYRPHGGAQEERGVITSVSSMWVFVRYGSDANSKATSPTQLEFAEVPS